MDATLLGQRKTNERSALCAMVDRSELENVLLIADRGYEGLNLFLLPSRHKECAIFLNVLFFSVLLLTLWH